MVLGLEAGQNPRGPRGRGLFRSQLWPLLLASMSPSFGSSPVVLFSSLAALLAIGCGGASAPPASPDATSAPQAQAHAAASKSTPTSAVPAHTDAAPAEPAAEAKPADEPRDGLRKASRPPIELLTGNNVVYVFNFAQSRVGEAAKERCDADNQGDLGAARECLNKERAKVAVESVRFVKDPSGQYWWVTYNRYKGNLLKWHRIQFLPGKADADSVTLNLTGKDRGIAPMPKVPTFLNVELPNDYSIVVSDPEYGAMLYDAKIGLMDKD
jgi:hypothetical protein